MFEKIDREIEKIEDLKPAADRKYSFIKQKRQDADSAYERISILKKTMRDLEQDINNTNCSNMDYDLMRTYDDIIKLFKYAIVKETEIVKDGE